MGTISIFSLDFSGTRLACSRSFDGAYHLTAGSHMVQMTPDVARALAGGGQYIRLRAQVADYFRREMKPGATYRRSMLSVDGHAVNLELGVTDGGDAVYVEINAARMTLAAEQAQLLLAVLDQLAADTAAIASATEQPVQLNLTPGLRNLPPLWMRD
jgi:hypothetical protein